MSNVFANRVLVSTATTGTGTVTLGAALAGYRTFASAGIASADVVRYLILDGNAWEIGTGTYTASGTTLSRTVQESSAGGTTALNLTGGARVAVIAAAQDYRALGRTGLRSAYGGTANAITLTTGAGISGTPPAGFGLRFRAINANTGATTIALDGGAAVAARTITGVALPSGYIRTDVDTVAVFDGTFWVLDRAIQRGSGANGEFVRLADGSQICWHNISVTDQAIESTYGNVFVGARSWTFPAVFSTAPVVPAPSLNWGATPGGSWGSVSAAPSTTSVTFRFFDGISRATGTAFIAYFSSIGRWF
jgi:hypothetical protein